MVPTLCVLAVVFLRSPVSVPWTFNHQRLFLALSCQTCYQRSLAGLLLVFISVKDKAPLACACTKLLLVLLSRACSCQRVVTYALLLLTSLVDRRHSFAGLLSSIASIHLLGLLIASILLLVFLLPAFSCWSCCQRSLVSRWSFLMPASFCRASC